MLNHVEISELIVNVFKYNASRTSVKIVNIPSNIRLIRIQSIIKLSFVVQESGNFYTNFLDKQGS